MTASTRRAFVRWCIRRELTEAQGEALLLGLARVGLCLDVTLRNEHIRMRTSDGQARLRGFMVLHGLGPTREEQ